MLNTIVTPTPVELPAITPENAADILAGKYLPKPPDEASTFLAENPRLPYTWVDPTRTMNGQPVECFAFLRENDSIAVMAENLWPCSMPGCEGHDVTDGRTWGELIHAVGGITVDLPLGSVKVEHMVRDDVRSLYVTFGDAAGPLDVDGVEALCEALAALPAVLREQRALAEAGN